MAVDNMLILKLEQLAKLRLEESERKEIGEDLKKMLEMIDVLSEVDTDGVEPMVYMHEEVNVLREDKVDDRLDREKGMSSAPRRIGNYFAIPKVVKR